MQKGNISFEWDASRIPQNPLQDPILLNGNNLKLEIHTLLNRTNHNVGHPLRTSKRIVLFPSEIEDLCNEVFDAIKIIKNNDNDDVLAAYLASRLFEYFYGYWNNLLINGQHLVGVSLWQAVLKIVTKWENNNDPIVIHKGTPFFFLAENYFVIGDRDNGFVYLYSALEDDKKLPQLGYPEKAPAYFTAKMLDESRNHMYHFIVRELRLKLSSFLVNFNQKFSSDRLPLVDFDTKFLKNSNLEDLVYFFVYNFFTIHNLDVHIHRDQLENDFSRLKILDLFFNFSLIIDEILKHSSSSAGNNFTKMRDCVFWWANQKTGITNTEFRDLIGSNNLNLNNDSPNIVVPKLLTNIENSTTSFREEVYVMLLAYHLRNHAGHNIQQQSILSTKYDDIIKYLVMALFFAVKTL